MKFKTYVINKSDINAKDSFKELSLMCLKNGLHNKKDDSLLQRTLKRDDEFSGCYAIVVFDKDIPIGISYVIHNDYKNIFGKPKEIDDINYEKHHDNWCFNRAGVNGDKNGKMKLSFNFWIANPGKIMFYIKEEYRGKGIASDLALKMENLIIIEHKKICEKYGQEKEGEIEDIIVLSAREKAIDLVRKNCKKIELGLNGLRVVDGNYPQVISSITYQKVFIDNLDYKVYQKESKTVEKDRKSIKKK